jgi:alpha-ketoglutarate-dependent taurine dioxygenase
VSSTTVRMEADFKIKALTPRLGAVVEGVDAKLPLNDVQVFAIQRYLMAYKVLFFRCQNLNYDQHARFARYFGEPLQEPYVRGVPGYPGLSNVDRTPFFHSDLMQMNDPPRFSILQIDASPDAGGDSMFADLVTSYEDLSEPMRRFLEQQAGLYAREGFDFETDGVEFAKGRMARTGGNFDDILATVEPNDHPLVRLIPENGKKNYLVSQAFTRSINGLTKAESEAILDFLFRHQLQPNNVIRWHWGVGDIAFWDHRTTLHSGIADFGSQERHGIRATIAGGRPIPVLDLDEV